MQEPQNIGRLVAALLLVALAATGCERDRPAVYDANGPYAPRANQGGKRLIVTAPDGTRIAKLRSTSSRHKVYDKDMLLLGKVVVNEGTIKISLKTGEELTVVQSERGAELSQHFRAESVENGWALFDKDAKTVGYVWQENEEWRYRRDYSSPASRIARMGQRFVEVPDGDNYELTRSNTPPALALALTVTELDPIARTALGAWLNGLD